MLLSGSPTWRQARQVLALQQLTLHVNAKAHVQVGDDVAVVVPYDAAAGALRHLCAVQRERVPPAESRNRQRSVPGVHRTYRTMKAVAAACAELAETLTRPSGW